jgi:squalene synthase HpnC
VGSFRHRRKRLQRRLHAALAVEREGQRPHEDEDLIIIAIAHSIRALDLPVMLFDDLVSAFGQDTMTCRYASWHDLLDYCRRSANPVGRLVLRIAGLNTDALDRSSDALCTALQLTNFWQDFGRDWRAGRLYLPRDVFAACGAREDDLAAGRMTSEWSEALSRSVRFTRDLFAAGRAVCDEAGGRLGIELKLTWLGGARILDEVDRTRDRALDSRPTLGRWDVPPLLWQAVRWRRAA